MKTWPLIKANLKQFIRNWKSMLLLVIMPLILILIIFSSFNPSGLRKVEIGYSLSGEQTLDEHEFQEAMGSFTRLTKYQNPEQCKTALRDYDEYVCVHISGTGPFLLDVYYDNTREPVIWEIIQRLEQAVRTVQQRESRGIASDFLTRFQRALDRLDGYDRELSKTNNGLDGYITEIDGTVVKLQSAKTDLVSTLDSMDRDIAQARSSSANARYEEQNYYSSIMSYISVTENNINYIAATPETQGYKNYALSEVGAARDQTNQYHRQATSDLNDIDARISSYEQASARGRTYTYQMDNSISELRSTKNDLRAYQARISLTRGELQGINDEFKALRKLDAETLVNPVVIRNYPMYVPDAENLDALTNSTAEDAAAAASFISLQTIFPTVLVLITLFLSLLIGSFIALGEINDPAHTRLRLVRRIFFPEFFASFISALILVIVPVLVIMTIGDVLFRLGITTHIFTITTILLLVVSIFILIGFLLAYIIRKESLTLTVSTFVLVILIFFSGFLLPIERMSPLFGAIGAISPGALSLAMFKQTIFYGATFTGIALEFWQLTAEAIVLLFVTLAVRYWKD